MIDDRSLQALRAAMKVLHSSPDKAAQVFVLATGDNPELADAWLGRYATGERSMQVLERLASHADRLGEGLLRIQHRPADLGAHFDIDYVRMPIVDTTTARLAYAAALIREQNWQGADDAMAELPATPSVGYVRSVLATATKRWPDVLVAVSNCRQWHGEPHLRRAASLQEAWAAASLGLSDRALAAVELVINPPADDTTSGWKPSAQQASDELTRDALFCRALVLRHQGEPEEARTVLTNIRVQWPGFERAQTALSDPTFGLQITDPQTIETRTDRWDPSTETSAEQRAAAESARSAQTLLAEAEAELAAMVGLDEVKARITELRNDSIARVLRQRKGLPTSPVSRHLLMMGPPGVGKTASARAVARIFCGLGLLRRPDVYETRRDKLVGRHVGDTENNTRDQLKEGLGATVFIDEFGDLIHTGYGSGDPYGQAIISTLVPFMENHRDEMVVIAAGYPMASQRVLAANDGLRSRFATLIEYASYNPDQLIAIMEGLAAKDGDTFAPGALLSLRESFAQYYNSHITSSEGDVIRVIDGLGNGRFVRTMVEKAQVNRNSRIVSSLGLSGADLSDPDLGTDLDEDTLTLLTAEDVHYGHQQALPPEMRTNRARAADWLRESQDRRQAQPPT
ncbi:type VII secretion AAA-ATPase EccA (plasmid) [Mycobacterium dioxanotrophicus]|uniref:Type VII secretion AAA-ATPase EccA n=1 Tax=Mycobacterium dioxanotrophicus TaxID=482462 RepID=A0A1Y0CH04_9MYCO|nr:type VII secretion AAA-ATPase EccA [Mycobacterium dioxanotrophicus]ART74225.1 type VII secretion AAA-ATPase EccA [Mycobacterium dioxanotrophicus]